jgi:DNA-binding beta-propeller fold protein YncE
MSNAHPTSSHQLAACLFALCVLLVLTFLAATSASADDMAAQSSHLPTSEDFIQAIEARGSQLNDVHPTDPELAESLPHRDLGREEALELLQGVFEAQLQAPAGVFDQLEVEKFLTPNVVLVGGEDPPTLVPAAASEMPPTESKEEPVPVAPRSEKEELRAQSPSARDESKGAEPGLEGHGQLTGATLLSSTIPLRTESPSGDPEVVNLSLDRTGGEIQPAAPLVEVDIPGEIDEGIELPGAGVTIELAGAPAERATSIIDQSAGFAPNVAPDTDLAVAPTPTGVETLTQMRSADSPDSETFNLDLPTGATLEATEDGGATVIDGEETLVSVAAPTAIDASGSEVPVSLDVSGDSLTLIVSPSESTQLPILVDPLFQTYEWASSTNGQNGICSNSFKYESFNACTNREEWGFEHHESYVPNHIELSAQKYSGGGSGTPGLTIETHQELKAGNSGSTIYTVPRYFTDQTKYGSMPTSYISHMTFWNLDWNAWSSHLSPYLFAGIWDPIYQGWVSYNTFDGLIEHGVHDMNWKYQFSNPNSSGNADTHAKVGYVSVQATETQPNENTAAYVGSASVELADEDIPALGAVSGPSGWVNQTARPVSFMASDSGLGVQSLTATDEAASPHSWKTSYGCIGVGDAACPHTWQSTETSPPALKYEPSLMPQGIHYLSVVAEDPVGNKSAPAYAQVKVDHTTPEVALSGTMTEQGALGKKRPTYTIKAATSDGTEAQPQSGVAKVRIEVDGKVEAKSEPGCATKNCAIPLEWTLESSKYSAGQHTIKVVATDGVELATTKTLTIELQPSPPSLALSGTMTEQGTLGASRPRYKLNVSASAEAGVEHPSPPTFASVVGSSGSGTGQFSHPGDVALDSKGNLWALDKGNNRIEEFNEKGEYVKKFGASGTANGQLSGPAALAIDTKGNIWVADTGNNRIEEFNEKGEYVTKIGASGSGNGQFYGPEGVAIDPKGNIWVADTYNARLEEFNEKGEFVKVVGKEGSAPGQLIEPTGIDIGPGGNVWVADWENNRVEVYNEAGEYVRQFGSAGTGNGQFSHPDALAIDTKGDVWVGDQDHGRVEEFNQSGEYLAQFGSAGPGQGQFSFGYPMGIAVDSKGSIWVTDTGHNQVQRWLIPGYAPAYSSSMGSAGAGNGQLSNPADSAIDADGNLLVVDKGNNRVEKLNPKGEYLSQFGGAGSSNGQLNSPSGIATDSEGNIWVTDTGNNRVEKFNPKGEYLSQFGAYGSGNGQFKGPAGIAISQSNGAIYVTDRGNHRVERFTKTGAYFGQAGSYGWEDARFNEPAGIALGGPSGEFAYTVLVVDSGNNRVQQFTPLGVFLGKFGSLGSGPGQLSRPGAIDVDAVGNVWVGDQNNNRIEEFTQSGQYLAQFGSSGSGQAQFSLNWPAGIASSAKGTLWVTDGGNNRIQRWSQSNLRSEITTEVSIDGKLVNTGEGGCITEQCPLAREWTLDSSGYSPGKHTILAKATDGLGNTTTKSLTVEVQPDATKPTLEVSGELFNAPEGWVEQEDYGLNASANDGGYGVTSLSLKIDGQQVTSVSQACADGGCLETLAKSINMSSYSGGTHLAELIATDGAGNSSARHWTINVDPDGHITANEAQKTLQASDATSGSAVVAPTSALLSTPESAEGYEPKLVEGENQFESTGVPDKSLIPPTGKEGFTVELPEGAINAEPLQSSEASPGIIAEEAAVVAGNSFENVDIVLRPIYDGILTFASIRDSSAAETFEWQVALGSEQILKPIDSKRAEVDYEDGHEAYLITAEPASDAVGTTVPTSLSVSHGDIITLKVEHRQHEYVYPVVAGAGWEGGFHTEKIVGPPNEKEIKEEEERIRHEEWEAMEHAAGEESGGDSEELYVSPPEPASAADAEVEDLAEWHNGIEHKNFRWIQCHHIDGFPDVKLIARPGGVCGNPFTRDPGTEDIAFNYGIRGDYYIVPGKWVKHKGSSTEHIECDKMYDRENIENAGLIHWDYYINPARKCEWYGHTRDGGGSFAEYGKHITPYGEWVWGYTSNPGDHQYAGLALYLWASKDEHVGHHTTTCIDCY